MITRVATTDVPSLTTPRISKPLFELKEELPPSFYERLINFPPPRW